MLAPYPLRFAPFFRDYLWGGRNLQTMLGKDLPAAGVWAESWEIVDHSEHSSVVANGPLAGKSLAQLGQTHHAWLYGPQARFAALPLLLKYLDCQRVLSVQVHPDDAYAARMSPPDLGKTEAWFIIAAQPEARLYAGLRPEVTRAELEQALHAGSVEDCLHTIHPQAGDCVFIPAGTVHALGAGLLVAEIQQASNTTFRLFDWNRLDAQGQPRPLHITQSLEVIDFASGPRPLQTPHATREAGRQRLVACDKFVLDRIQAEPTSAVSAVRCQFAGDGQFHLFTVPVGSAHLRWDDRSEVVIAGQSLLIPAAMPTLTVELSGPSIALDMMLPAG